PIAPSRARATPPPNPPIHAALHRFNVTKLHQWPRRWAGESQPIRYRSTQCRIFASEDQRTLGKKCRRYLFGNLPERGRQDGDKLVLEKRDRLERRILDRKRAQAEAERVGLEHLQRCGRQTCFEIDLQLRMIGLESLPVR